ncbi:uncharacterized protein TRIADDRAFT_58026 [Trichoplax adhaerens]|uniref:Rho-GAP domain-containing protein n=1 Tax=Trichoplax adhaerens TaxID=10228 RepID=B3S2H4_TRIAD|nr:predicted protein [Trichoplax adhaerens]EDV23420.1 predicted protein [Trichoplax adhaerens]|eukprot:XP_002114330.1 predicted protein [Trichoplax adhaerens]
MSDKQFVNQQSVPAGYTYDNQAIWPQDNPNLVNSPSNPRKSNGIKKQYSQLIKKNIAKKFMQRRASDISDDSINRLHHADPGLHENGQESAAEHSYNITSVTHIRDESGAYSISRVELMKTPGVSIGFYIRNGDGFDRLDGIFVSRIALGSVVDVNNLVQIGDELLNVNNVSVADMTLDDVVVLLRNPTKLSLTLKRRVSTSCRNSPTEFINRPQHLETNRYTSYHQQQQLLSSSKGLDHSGSNHNHYPRQQRHRHSDPQQPFLSSHNNSHQSMSNHRSTTNQLLAPSRTKNNRRSSDQFPVSRKGIPSSLEILNEGSIIDYGGTNHSSNRTPMISPVNTRFYQTGNDSSYFSATESYDSTSENYNYNSDSYPNSNHEDSDTQQDSIPSPKSNRTWRSRQSDSQRRHGDDINQADKNIAHSLLSLPCNEDRRHSSPILPAATLPDQQVIRQNSESTSERDHDDIVMTISSQSEADNSSIQSSDDSVRPDTSISSDEDDSSKMANSLAQKMSLQLNIRKQLTLPIIAIDSDCTDSGASTPVLETPPSNRSSPSPIGVPSPLTMSIENPPSSDQRERSYSADDDEIPNSQNDKPVLDTKKMTLTPGIARANLAKKEKKRFRFKNTTDLLGVPPPVGTPVLNGKGKKKFSNKRNRSKSLSAIVGMGLVAAQASSMPSDNMPSSTKTKSTYSKKKLFASPKSSQRKQILDVSGMLGMSGNSNTTSSNKKSQRCPSYTQYELDHDFIAHFSEAKELRVSPPSVDGKEALLSGRLSVNLLCGKDMTSSDNGNNNNCKQRDVYCIIEVDGEIQAKTNSKRGTTLFEWDESFEIDLDCCQYVSFKCFVGNSKSTRLHNKSLFVSGNVNFAKLIHTYGPNHQLALHTKPFGVIYAKFNFVGQESTFQRRPSARTAGVFGVDLAAVTQREGNQVPQIVQKCIAAIEERGMDTVGLYRLCGSAKRKQTLRTEFEFNAMSVNLADIERYPDINVLTGVLKDYLRELPEPLLTNELYPTLFDNPCILESKDCDATILNLMNSLPEPNRSTLSFILDHLVRVGKFEDSNKMSFHNLAICFGPVLMCSSKDTTNGIDSKSVNRSIPLQSLTQDFRQHIIILERILQVWSEYMDKGKVPFTQTVEKEKDGKAATIPSFNDTDSDDESDSYV